MGIFSFESFALAVLIVALAAFLAWRQMREAAEPLEERRDQREEGKNIIVFSDTPPIVVEDLDFRDALAKYNDTEHEQPCASMEPMCGAANPTNLEAVMRDIAEKERQARSRRAIRRAQQAAHESKVRHFAEDLSKRDDEMVKVINGIQRRVLDEQRAALDRIAGKKP